ncbi:MAG: methyltransferase domain-containing protein [Methylobacter sp.]
MSDDFYRAFEERYYASQSVIKQLRKQYLPFVQPLVTLYPESQTFDLGCGRGEWLEIMAEIGLKPYGVDLDDGMLRACHEKGLPVQKGDAVKYLKTLTSESQLVVSAFHVVEHITFSELRTVVSEALRVLKPGGLLIMETPNPENITVATRNFYLDPTHQRPIPPQLLSFLPEYYGFARVKVIRLQEEKSLAGKAWTSLRDVLSGVSPDYAVVAQKSADDPLLACISDAFAQEYGLTLDALVEKFDQQATQASERASSAETHALQASERTSSAETHALQASERASSAETHALQASERASSAETHALQASERASSAETQAQQAETALIAIHNSSSWRLTAPFRYIKGTVLRLNAAIREGRLISGLKRRINSLRYISMQSELPKERNQITLSPRAARIYADLQKAVKVRKN